MSQQVSGIINEVTEKPWEDRETGKDIILYSFTLEGNRKFFRTGTNPVPYGAGEAVSFLVNGQRVDLASMETVEASAIPAPAPAAKRSNGAGASSSRDDYWAAKEARDIERNDRYQEIAEPRMALSVAVQAASRVVVAALENDALSFGTTAKSKREGMLCDFVKTIAADLALFIQSAPEVLAHSALESEDDEGE